MKRLLSEETLGSQIEAALQECGILIRRKYQVEPETRFQHTDGFFQGDDIEYEYLVKYEVLGKLMTMIAALKEKDKSPYFISFHQDGTGDIAEFLHAELKAAGCEGFCSKDGMAGNWQVEIIEHLKRSKTLIMLESTSYHDRPRCKVERDYAVAAGIPIVRLKVDDQLSGKPPWFDEKYSYLTSKKTKNACLSALLAATCPGTQILSVRKLGIAALCQSLTEARLTSLAIHLNKESELSGSHAEKRNTLASIASSTDNVANSFCMNVDLVEIF